MVDIQADEETNRLLAELTDIYPLLQSEAEDSERLRRPTPVVQDALRDSGIFKLMMPAGLGGLEASPSHGTSRTSGARWRGRARPGGTTSPRSRRERS
ncbi:hypothetical protein [Streptomyces sp. NPDC127105]|uniref:hypothetical protein n=1 Tax=Streptomyces sp. NPDC127105 TaxID=3345359 RepID=UPI003658D205